ncbi:DUF748 domain-containing protein [Marinicella gelatinilytica]|uniref:DUF748 domain-containing protein n=1 Tax=Marinicella gelatinilytica TaxID=2996017 RepID=UPI002260C82E|nr:DUF748 domain-containing protein [Marinicella gelatinilytica]MCX7545763.1 DUF748 domain-containing protein [Marinicella gelatinilytica]
MTKSKRRRQRIIGLFFLIGMVVYFVALLWVLPSWLKAPINNRLKEQNLQIDYQKLWINPLTLNIHINDLSVKDLSQTNILRAQQAHIDWHIIPLMQEQVDIQKIRLEHAHLNIVFDEQNQLISPKLSQSNNEPSVWQINFGQLDIIDSVVTVTRQQQQFKVTDIDVDINLSDITNEESMFVSLKTQPDGELKIQKKPAGNQDFHWQLSDWPLTSLAMWLPAEFSETNITGLLSAQGVLRWPKNQQPIMQISNFTVHMSQLQWPPLNLVETIFEGQAITVDFNTYNADIGQISSNKGQLMANIDPLNIMEYFPESESSDASWTWQLQNLSLTDWQISLAEQKPPVIAQIQELSLTEQKGVQILTMAGHLTSPFEHPVNISTSGFLNPVRLKGEIVASELDLSRMNPWLVELSPWQIQHGELTVNSAYCFQQGVISTQGMWQLPDLMASDNKQQVKAQQLNLASIVIDSNHRTLSLNDITTNQIEVRQMDEETLTKGENILNQAPPPQVEGLWRVLIDHDNTKACHF